MTMLGIQEHYDSASMFVKYLMLFCAQVRQGVACLYGVLTAKVSHTCRYYF